MREKAVRSSFLAFEIQLVRVYLNSKDTLVIRAVAPCRETIWGLLKTYHFTVYIPVRTCKPVFSLRLLARAIDSSRETWPIARIKSRGYKNKITKTKKNLRIFERLIVEAKNGRKIDMFISLDENRARDYKLSSNV